MRTKNRPLELLEATASVRPLRSGERRKNLAKERDNNYSVQRSIIYNRGSTKKV